SEDLTAGLLVNPFPGMEVPTEGDWYLVYPESRARLRKMKLFRRWLVEEIEADPDIGLLRKKVA
ncbi:MAG: hypothetical protein QNK91_09495, partial [Parasphingorhabdus sp.]